MKRMASLILFVMLATILAACGGTDNGTTGTGAGAASPAGAGAAASTAGGTGTEASPSAAAAASPAASPAASAAAASPAAQASVEPTPAVQSLGSGGTTIVLWHAWRPEYLKSVQTVFADYASKNNVTIQLVQQADIQNKIGVAVPSGQGPDVIAWVNDIVGKNALSGIIQPLDEYGVDKAYISQNYTPVAADAVVYDDKVYGIPESMEALTFIYNKALIQEGDLPKNTDELIAKSKEYNAANEGKYLFVYNAKNDPYFSAPWWHGSGVQLVTDEGTTELGSEKGLAAANLIRSFTEVMPNELDYSVADTLFKEGKAAIIMNGPWSIPDYQAAGLDVGVSTIPVVSNSGQPGKPFVGVKLLMLSAESKNPQPAVDLMKYYGSAEVQGQLAEINKLVPANAAAQEQVKDDPIVAGFIEQTNQGVAMPNTEFIDAMWDPVGKTVEAIWTGASPPEQAIQDGSALFDEKVQDLK